MAELSPIPSAQRPSDVGYQPVSAYAVAAAVAAGAFVLLLIVLVIAAAISKRSALSYELLLLPLAGLILAVIGRSHVRNSEGARTGLRLANGAWWVCVLGGVGFLGYMYANEFALEKKSGQFAERFLEELKAGRMQHAFLYLVPPDERQKAEVTDSPEVFEAAYLASGYTFFRNHELVRLIVRNGSAAQIEHLGVAEVGQIATGFQATHMYRVTCPEGVYGVKVRTVAAEVRSGGELRWRIPTDPAPNISMKADKVSTYGRLVTELEQEGIAHVNLWMANTTSGRELLAQLMTTPQAHREPIEKALRQAMFLGGAAAVTFPLQPGLLPPDRARSVTSIPQARLSFEDLVKSDFFRRNDRGDPLSDDKIAKLRSLWVAPRLQPVGASRQAQKMQVPSDSSTIALTATSITVNMPVELSLDIPAQFSPCVISIVCTDPAVLAAVAAIRDRGANDADPTVSVNSLPPRNWRIAALRTDLEASTMATGPGSSPPGGR